jgi:hypothetical protein
VAPNIFTASTFLTDAISLRGGVPLFVPQLGLSTSAGYTHGVGWDSATGVLSGATNTFLADVTLSYNPWPEMGIFARYQFTDQLGTSVGPSPTATFFRNTVLLGLTVIYPARSAAPYGYQRSVRADRSDEMQMFQSSSPLPQENGNTPGGPSAPSSGTVAPSGPTGSTPAP